jgi:hypothetical protein
MMRKLTVQDLRNIGEFIIRSNHISGVDRIWVEPISEENIYCDYVYSDEDILFDDCYTLREFLTRYEINEVYLDTDAFFNKEKPYKIDFEDNEDVIVTNYYNKLRESIEEKQREQQKQAEIEQMEAEKNKVRRISLHTLINKRDSLFVSYNDEILELLTYAEESEDDPNLFSEIHVWQKDGGEDVVIECASAYEVLDFFKDKYVYFEKEHAEKDMYRYTLIDDY